MKLAGPILIGVVLTACLGAPASVEPSIPGPSEVEPTDAGSIASAPANLTAAELLECDAGPSEVGGFGEDVAIDGGGATPEEALAAFLSNTFYVIPRSGYEPIGQSGDRYAFGYRSDDEVKVVIVISPRFGELVDAAFAPDELRTCPEAEFGSEAVFNDDRRTWTHVETGAILTDIAGPQHCGWQSARMLHVLKPDGSLWKQYVRDPEGVFDQVPKLDSFALDVQLPDDATDSGYRSPEGYELWFTESDTAAYVVTPDGIERWPRPSEPIGCA